VEQQSFPLLLSNYTNPLVRANANEAIVNRLYIRECRTCIGKYFRL
jgi:hypothetical protein